MQWAEQLREEYSKIAKENMSKGGQSCPTLENIETSKKISEDLDIGQTTLKKAQYIWNNADEEIIKELDEGKLSINKAYNTLKDKLKQQEEKNQEEKNQELRQALDREKNKPKEKEYIEKVVDNTDYTVWGVCCYRFIKNY
ncbi:hypothetical protein ACQPUR_03220 [Clostridium neonatale]|uniref:hypothetical protein n=1 Tax=Clostridium neonatale TaxID=137838 RepID=UPI003D3473EF